MNITEIENFIRDNIKYKNWDFVVGEKDDVIYVQIQFDAADNFDTTKIERQYCRKWQLSEWMTPTEIVQTCWAAVIRAELHEAAEHFKFKGADIFNTHIDVEGLVELCQTNRYEHRRVEIQKETPKVVVKYVSLIRDGGTKSYTDLQHNMYFEDHRIGTKTKGLIYDRYPSEKDAKILNVILQEN